METESLKPDNASGFFDWNEGLRSIDRVNAHKTAVALKLPRQCSYWLRERSNYSVSAHNASRVPKLQHQRSYHNGGAHSLKQGAH